MRSNNSIINDIQNIIDEAQILAIRSVDHQRVLMYWKIGKRIFEEEQQGQDRATYGERLIPYLAEILTPGYGSTYSVRNLNYFRKFHRLFPIVNALRSQLTWTHYRTLLSLENEDKRNFYVDETVRNNWTARQMDRQVNSQLYERLLLSTDKKKVVSASRNQKLSTEPKE